MPLKSEGFAYEDDFYSARGFAHPRFDDIGADAISAFAVSAGTACRAGSARQAALECFENTLGVGRRGKIPRSLPRSGKRFAELVHTNY